VAEEFTSFQAGIDFESILRIISKQIYETPLAFIRENVQNAVDAIRIQAHRDGVDPGDQRYRIDINVETKKIIVGDNGNGMSASDLRDFFWTIGASGKRTQEALAAGCVGIFGIGGFANFGVCESLEVISQTANIQHGTLTRLSEQDIRAAGNNLPSVGTEPSDKAAPRGTLVIGYLREPVNVDQIHSYLRDFVRFVSTAVYFNGDKLQQAQFLGIEEKENLTEINGGTKEWQEEDLRISGRLYEDRGYTVVAEINGLIIGSEVINLVGYLRFENGPIDVFKRGFKLCTTQIGSTIGVSGRLDCDRFVPTAGRGSLDSVTTSLLNRIVLALEKVAVNVVLETPERIAQHTRIFRYILNHGLIGSLDNVRVRLADGSESSLTDIRRRAEQGRVGVFFGVSQKQALNQIMQARGHIVVLLSSDHNRQNAERRYLEQFCSAKPFDGIIDFTEHYEKLSRFERLFLSELEENISRSYEVTNFFLIAGKLTEDIPVFVREHSGNKKLEILVDVRHREISKLEILGFTPILYSLIANFCREYLGPSLKKWSPRFFGDGAMNFELLAKHRSELWILLKDDIGVVHKGGQRQVITSSDVQVVNVGGGTSQPEPQPEKARPRILHVVDEQGSTELGGYYLRLTDTAFSAYGDLLPGLESLGVVWAGNKIEYVASDTVSAVFHYEIRLDEVVAVTLGGVTRAEGAIQLEQPLQEMYEGLYFAIPNTLESFLVPKGDAEIRIELHCELFDIRTARHWTPKESS